MYYKIINGRYVFSNCKTIQLTNDYQELGLVIGQYISNPSVEMIEAEGWMEYIPPEVVPTPQTEPDYGQIIEAVKNMLSSSVESLTDEEALQVSALYPTWVSKVGTQINVNERLWYDGKLYKVIQQHIAQDDWTPDVSTSLFTEVSIAEWPEWIQPTGSHDAYMSGDKITYNGMHYVSLIDYNIYSPSDYPQGWELIA